MIVPTDHVAGKESVHNSPRRSGCLNFQRLTTLFTSYLATSWENRGGRGHPMYSAAKPTVIPNIVPAGKRGGGSL